MNWQIVVFILGILGLINVILELWGGVTKARVLKIVQKEKERYGGHDLQLHAAMESWPAQQKEAFLMHLRFLELFDKKKNILYIFLWKIFPPRQSISKPQPPFAEDKQ